MLDHFFISETDGALHDTRVPNWSSNPLRENYRRTLRNIESVSDFKATLRAGAYAWPGGYPMFFVTKDGASLSFESAMENFRQIADSIKTGTSDGWLVIGCDINYEDSTLVCDHSGESIPAAYS